MNGNIQILDLISNALNDFEKVRVMSIELSNGIFEKQFNRSNLSYFEYNAKRFEIMNHIQMDYLKQLSETLQMLSAVATEHLENKEN